MTFSSYTIVFPNKKAALFPAALGVTGGLSPLR